MSKKRLALSALSVLLLVFCSLWWFSTSKKSQKEPIRIAHQLSTGLDKVRSSGSPKAGVESKKARSAYFNRVFGDPATGRMPKNAGNADLLIAASIDAKASVRKTLLGFDWQEAGPSNVGGRTRALAADVSDLNTFIAAGVAGGIWKSENAGRSWRQVAANNQMHSVTSIAQDPRPGFQNRWYATGGEFDGSSAPYFQDSGTHYNTGILISDDNGENWRFVEQSGFEFQWTAPFSMTSRILVHKTTGHVYLASNGFGVYKSVDGGSSFAAVLDQQFAPRFSDIQQNKNGILMQYLSGDDAGTNDYTPGFYISWDNGGSWSRVQSSLLDVNNSRKAVIDFSYSNPNVGYALVFENPARNIDGKVGDDLSLYRFTLNPSAQTVSVQNLSNRLPESMGETDPDSQLPFNTQFNYNLTFAVHPANEATLFLGMTNLYRIRDINRVTSVGTPAQKRDVIIGGYAVNEQDFFYVDNSGQRDQHPDHHNIIFPDPENRPNYMVVANDGGLYSTFESLISRANGLIEWQNLNFGYNVTQFYHASVSPRVGQNQFMGGTQDNGTPFVILDLPAAATQSIGDVSSGDGSYSHFGREHVYTSSQNGVVNRFRLDQFFNTGVVDFTGYSYPRFYESQFANSESIPGDGGREFIHPFEVDPVTHRTMYYPAGSLVDSVEYQVFRNTQIESSESIAIASWEAMPDLAVRYRPTALTATVEPQGRLLVATSGENRNELFIIDGADTDNPVITERPISPFYRGNIRQIAVNPDDANEFILVYSNYNVVSLLHTTDNGQSFVDIEGNLAGDAEFRGDVFGLSIRTATILPRNGRKIYLVGTSAGLYSTDILDGSDTEWVKEAPNLIGDVPVTWITSRPTDGKVLVATHGRGAFWGFAEEVITALEEQQLLPENISLAQNYPNPFNPTTTLSFSLPLASAVQLEVFNMQGQRVARLIDRQMPAGEHQQAFDASSLSSGVYIYRLRAAGQEISRKMTLIK